MNIRLKPRLSTSFKVNRHTKELILENEVYMELLQSWILKTLQFASICVKKHLMWGWHLLTCDWMLVHLLIECAADYSWSCSFSNLVSLWPMRVCLIVEVRHWRELTTALINHFVKCHLQSIWLMEGPFNSSPRISFVRGAEHQDTYQWSHPGSLSESARYKHKQA